MTETLKHSVVSAAAVATVTGAAYGALWLYDRFTDADAGAAIGVGILWFLALGTLACLGGAWSGAKLGLLRAVAIWGVLGVVTSVALALKTATEDGGFDRSVFVSDLTWAGPFMLALLVLPAAGCAALVAATRRAAPHPSR